MRYAFYVHGFASSGRSTKAAMFADAMRDAGLTVLCPDFNGPAFETLTTTRILSQLEEALADVPPGPVALIGSSMGGFAAFLATVEQARQRDAGITLSHPIDRMVLLAPALDFGRTEYGMVDGPALDRWRQSGWLDVFHYGDNRPARVAFGLYEDAQRYDALAARTPVPTLVFQGTQDALVDPAMVRRYCATQPLITLRVVDDDHQLMSSVPMILRETAAFFGAAG